MGISKSNYRNKLNSIWNYIVNEKQRSDGNGDNVELEAEYKVLSHILGTSQDDIEVRVVFAKPTSDGEIIKYNYFSKLELAIQRLITKAYLGIQKESLLREKYEQQNEKLVEMCNEMEKELKSYKKKYSSLTEKLDTMVDIEKYRNLDRIYHNVEDENISLKRAISQLENKVKEQSGKYSELNSKYIQVANSYNCVVEDNKRLEKEKDEVVQTLERLNKDIEELQGLYKQEKFRADKAEQELIGEKSRKAATLFKTSNKEMDDLKNKVAEKNNEISSLRQELFDNKGKIITMQNQIHKLISEYSRSKTELEKQRIDFQAKEKELNTAMSELHEKIKKYKENEARLMPELVGNIYRREIQGKCITLDEEQIKSIIRGHLNGLSNYRICKDNHVSESSVRKILNCDYKAISSVKKISDILSSMNGNWGDEKKEELESLIKIYKLRVSEMTKADNLEKELIEAELGGIEGYNLKVNGDKL